MPLEYALQARENFVDADPWKEYPVVQIVPKYPIGLSVIANQQVKNNLKRAIPFNLIITGQSGLGKTTFINTLMKLDESVHYDNLSSYQTPTLSSKSFNSQVIINVIDTPGFGDSINRENNVDPIIELVESRFDEYMENEKGESPRNVYLDNRIHAVLYFIPPQTTGLKELDLLAIKKLSEKANLIPVLAKADTLTSSEKANLKQLILSQLAKENVKIYPMHLSNDQEVSKHLHNDIPFAVIGSNEEVDIKGVKKRARKYKWGIVEVENPEVSDFSKLKEFLLNLQMIDLVEVTNEIHYNLYRQLQLRKLRHHQSVLVCDEDYQRRIDLIEKQHQDEMSKSEQKMRDNFVRRVREKEAELRSREEDLERMKEEMIGPMKMEESMMQQEIYELDQILQGMGGIKDKDKDRKSKVAVK